MDKINEFVSQISRTNDLLQNIFTEDVKLIIGLLIIWILYSLLKGFSKVGDKVVKYIMPISILLSVLRILGFELPEQVDNYLDFIFKMVFFL